MLLFSTVDLLRQAYRALSRDDAEQSLIDAVHASGIPLQVSMDQHAGKTGSDLHSTLQAAQADATTDPERAIAVFRELLLSPAGASEIPDRLGLLRANSHDAEQGRLFPRGTAPVRPADHVRTQRRSQ